ncbi:MAG: bifunctional folylpolyglutamate synthase/dihydrofolate synthase [Pirellulales bacterium]|nr:bifunctional folylpolyglutamate synthase/dihydrofolate synthase [Pirellulales bacterium]
MSRPSPPDPSPRDQAADYLLHRVNYERVSQSADFTQRFKLDRMRELLHRIGSPESGIPVIHVAGTKGKGSTAAMIAAVLTDAGYRTGLFTSPHFERVEERLMVDGAACSGDELVGLVERVRPAVEAMDRRAEHHGGPDDDRPTYFEVLTAMALDHFARRAVDVAVLEVGLGGRLDSTNVAQTVVSVITSISLDHTAQLGDTLEAIAAEKAGILRPGVPLVSGVTRPAPRAVIRQLARRIGAPMIEAATDFETVVPDSPTADGPFDYYRRGEAEYRGLRLAMPGRHQTANAAVALAVIDELRKIGWNVPESAVRSGLARAVCPGRVEILDARPTVVLDVAHNRASVEALVEVLAERFAGRRKWALFAAAADKDLRGMLDVLLGAFDEVVFTRFLENPRAASPEDLARLAGEQTGRTYPIYPSPAASWAWLTNRVQPDDLICVTGSFFLVTEIRRILKIEPRP